MNGVEPGTPIAGYALIGDCHSAALVSRAGSIDWCCLPRFDSASCFARLLDRERGGACSLSIDGETPPDGAAAYVPDTLVLDTSFATAGGSVRVHDFFAMRENGADHPRRELVRIVECTRGAAAVEVEVAPRFDYGAVRPWLRRAGTNAFTAVGGDDGLLVLSDAEIESTDAALLVRARLRAGDRLRLIIRYVRPHRLARGPLPAPLAAEIDARLPEAIEWWRRWRSRVRYDGPRGEGVVRSALALKALSYAPTGAIAAAPTASLPESIGGERNWDYRFSWIRDATLAAGALAELGLHREAESFRHFIVRSSAGHAEDLQIMFGVGGERRLVEQELELAGYRGSRPARIGNRALRQLQFDAFGEILDLVWRWHRRGRSPDDDEWRFLAELVETVVERWPAPDRGIWEWRDGPRQFVHSKAWCWAALDRGLRLAEECLRPAPVRRWRRAQREIREAIEEHGYDSRRGVFVQCFDEPQLDAALLRLPATGFVGFDDERMTRTTDAVRSELDADGLLYRYRVDDGMPGREGAFVACSFWLAECYARQGRLRDAENAFDRAVATASPLGLFGEEADPGNDEVLGNYPQALSHLAHISAAVALSEAAALDGGDEPA